jgi:hypothetical protein
VSAALPKAVLATWREDKQFVANLLGGRKVCPSVRPALACEDGLASRHKRPIALRRFAA